MGKHHEKIAKSLEIRKANHKGPGGKVPGSMNKRRPDIIDKRLTELNDGSRRKM